MWTDTCLSELTRYPGSRLLEEEHMYYLIRKANGREEILLTELDLNEACQFWVALARANPNGYYYIYYEGGVR